MVTFTFTFIEEAHASCVVVTAETEEDCKEKYFMKYPERKDSPYLDIYEGDDGPSFILVRKGDDV